MRTYHKNNNFLYTVFFLGFLFTIHATLPVYISSTFLSQFISERLVGLIYMTGSVFTIIAFLNADRILKKIGNYRTALFFIIAQICALAGMIVSKNIYIVAPLFILHHALSNLLALNIDIFLESKSDNKHTGGIRGLFLTVINIAWILGPLLAGSILTNGDYWKIYLGSIMLAFPVLIILFLNFRNFKDPVYPKPNLRDTYRKIFGNSDLSKIFKINTLLHVFYGWMVIYTPIYLHEHIGFLWKDIGFIFTIMLLPFIIFELPFGKLADGKWGEKEFMTSGFIILAITTGLLSFISSTNVWFWALALFMTRIGAAIAEIMIETYFFKKIHAGDANVISLFRTTRPLSYLIAPFIAGTSLVFLSFQYSFIVLAVLMLFAIRYTMTIRDTA